MLEECLAASLGDLLGVRAGEKLDDKEVLKCFKNSISAS